MKTAQRWSFALIAVAMVSAAAMAAPMQWPDLLDRAKPQASTRVPYAKGDLHYADLWLPAGKGPFPVVLMVHGGCWQTDIADLSIMNWAADDLAKRGIAVWNIEYRGIDRPGGGYPGTYQDVAAAADGLRRVAPLFRLKADRVVVVGHSAGGHLGLWLAARPSLPKYSPLRSERPLPVAAVISLGGLPDLEREQAVANHPCGAAAKAMSGPKTERRPDPFRDTSPPAMAPFAARQFLISGGVDDIAPPSVAASYARRLAQKGIRPTVVTIADEGHVELIAPGSAAWAQTVTIIEDELGVTAKK